VLTCPWHAWRWDVTSGANVNNPALRLACFPVCVEGQGIFVDLP
jgi:nitrite reductase/ring-hydroxylating ferredoxin subunit